MVSPLAVRSAVVDRFDGQPWTQGSSSRTAKGPGRGDRIMSETRPFLEHWTSIDPERLARYETMYQWSAAAEAFYAPG